MIDCFVDLDADQKGAHMSRFPELFGEAIDELVIAGTLLVEELAEHIAEHIVERQRAGRAEVQDPRALPDRAHDPGLGAADAGARDADRARDRVPASSRRVIGVEATGINACPCAQGLVRDRAAERLGDAGFGDVDIERILDLVPLATHNQRGRGTLYLGTEHCASTRRSSSSWSRAR